MRGKFCASSAGYWLGANGTTPLEFYELVRSLGMKPTEKQTGESLEGGNILFTVRRGASCLIGLLLLALQRLNFMVS
jgi:hypothetical protein